MESINYENILTACIGVAKKEVGKAWKNLKPYAEHEFKQFAENAAFLAQLKFSNTINDNELMVRLNIQRLALNNVLLTIEGIGLLSAQNVVNAVLAIVATAIRTVLGVVLPV